MSEVSPFFCSRPDGLLRERNNPEIVFSSVELKSFSGLTYSMDVRTKLQIQAQMAVIGVTKTLLATMRTDGSGFEAKFVPFDPAEW